MESFAFHPELFEFRTIALEMLADQGFVWLFDFGSVDILHDVCGLEVCGIREQEDAHTILALLRKKFSSWCHSRFYYNDHSERDPGWKVIISRDPEDFEDKWQRVS
jgi:hypothetical protein